MISVIVTGARTLADPKRVHDALDAVAEEWGGILWLVDGGCPTGADAFARSWKGAPKHRRTMPADWSKGGRGGPMRNRAMLNAYPDALVLAFPVVGSRGTVDCIRQAQKRHRLVRVIGDIAA